MRTRISYITNYPRIETLPYIKHVDVILVLTCISLLHRLKLVQTNTFKFCLVSMKQLEGPQQEEVEENDEAQVRPLPVYYLVPVSHALF